MTISLKNKKIKSRVNSFSIEQALYFEPYEESSIDNELLIALRNCDLKELSSLLNKKDGNENAYDLNARNQFGENLLHLACRMGLERDLIEFLVEDAIIQLNVRDRYGRSPLHNACMSSKPNFDNINYIMDKAPRLTVFEDDNGKVPFDLIPQRCFEQWTRFLSEKNVLRTLSTELLKEESLPPTE